MIQKEIEEIIVNLNGLKIHSRAQIRRTSERLRGMNFDPQKLYYPKSIVSMDADETFREICAIAHMSSAELVPLLPYFVPTSFGVPEESNDWEEELKLRLMRRFFRAYSFLCKLRSGEDEAWERLSGGQSVEIMLPPMKSEKSRIVRRPLKSN